MVSQDEKVEIVGGVSAWVSGKKYHSASQEAATRRPWPVYHTQQWCEAGVAIELRHLRQGKGGRDHECEDCTKQSARIVIRG
jgi:hypothetical protein